MSWPWRLVLLRRAWAGLMCVFLLTTGRWHSNVYKAVIDLKARPMHNRAALGNRPRDVREGLGAAMFRAPYPFEQLRGASLT